MPGSLSVVITGGARARTSPGIVDYARRVARGELTTWRCRCCSNSRRYRWNNQVARAAGPPGAADIGIRRAASRERPTDREAFGNCLNVWLDHSADPFGHEHL